MELDNVKNEHQHRDNQLENIKYKTEEKSEILKNQ